MPLPRMRLSVGVLWVSLMVLTFMFVDAWSGRNWVYLMAASVIPPFVFLRVWNDGPPPTVAELLRSTEEQR